ncbi:MAG: hypothetical protein JWO38_2417 [Gemmataceae bacterium]|nr:hypothetical protein [Gemmataceae bacterium]
MADPTTLPSPSPADVRRPAAGVGVLAVYAEEDTDTVRPAVEAVRACGFNIRSVSETDPGVWGREPETVLAEFPPQNYPAVLTFLSASFTRSGFCSRVLESLTRPAEHAPPYRLILPVRLDGTPPPPPIDRIASVDFRQLSAEVFAGKVGDAVSGWVASGGENRAPVTRLNQSGPEGSWYRAAFVLGLETDRRTQDGLRALVETFPTPERQLFEMAFLKGYDDRQIADHLDTFREAVPLRIDRLLKQIRSQFPRVY